MAGGGRRPGRGTLLHSVALRERPLNYITDNFNRSDSSTSLGTASDGGTWTIDGTSTFGISSNQAYCVNNAAQTSRARRNTYQVAADVSVTQTFSSGTRLQIWFAYDPATGTGYLMHMGVSCAILKTANGGVSTSTVATVGTLPTSGQTVRVTYNPSTGVISLFYNGVLQQQATDGTPITSRANTWVGFGASADFSTSGQTWDNFLAVSSSPAVAFMQQALANPSTGSQNTSFTVSLSTGLTAGSTLVLAVAYSGGISSVTGCGATWTRKITNSDGSAAALVDVWVGTAGTTGQTTVTVNFSGTTLPVMNLSEWWGVVSIGSATGVLNSSATSATTPSVTPASNEVAYGVVAINSTGGHSISSYTDSPASWTTMSSGNSTWMTYTLAPAYLTSVATAATRQGNFSAASTSITESLVLSTQVLSTPHWRPVIRPQAVFSTASVRWCDMAIGRRFGRGAILHPVIRTRHVTPVLLVSSTDSFTGGSSQNVSTLVSSTDSGVSSSSEAVALLFSSTDSATLTEAALPTVVTTDTATLTESWLFALSALDARTAADIGSFNWALADAGATSESGSVVVTVTGPPGTGFDVPPAVDQGILSESAGVSPIFPSGVSTTLTQWAFIDPQGVLAPYVFAVNPNQMTDPTRKKTTTSVGISPISTTKSRGYRTNRLSPREWTFSGVTIAQDQQDQFLAWFNVVNKIWLRDHFGRIWEVRLMQFDQEPRPSSRTNPLWRFQYTFSAQAYRRIS